jgi:TonB family protein
MKKLTVVLLLWLVFSFTVQGQALAATSQDANSKAQEKSPELIEASKLSAQVVQYHKEGKYEEALPLAKRVVEIREKVLGDKDTLVGDAHANLASIYVGKKKLYEAASSFRSALKIYEKAYGTDSPKLCGVLDNLGWINFGVHNPASAQDFLKRSLAIREKAFGANSKEVAQSLIHLGQLNQNFRYYPTAIPFYQRAFDILEKNPETDKKELADLAQKCSCVFKLNKQETESEEYAKRAHEIRNPEGSGANVVRRTGGVLAGSAIHKEEPEYPDLAKHLHVSGAVIVEVTVDETGKVIQSRVLCGDVLLSYHAEQAARKWRFTPTLLSGVPVKVIGTITFNFNL